MIKRVRRSAERRPSDGRRAVRGHKPSHAAKPVPSHPHRLKKRGRLDKKILARIVERIVEAAQPEKIILFGSAARGTMGPNSDADLLVVKGGKFRRWDLAGAIYRHLHGVGAAVDVVIVTPDELERYSEVPFLVIYPALREGRVVYGA
jgi:uncharacterized protein